MNQGAELLKEKTFVLRGASLSRKIDSVVFRLLARRWGLVQGESIGEQVGVD